MDKRYKAFQDLMVKTYGFCNWQCELAWKSALESQEPAPVVNILPQEKLHEDQ